MVSTDLFSSYPPFPHNVPTASVAKISFAKLAAGDGTEALRMFDACRSLGFFLMDLQDEPSAERFLRAIDSTFEVAKQVFDLSSEEKAKYSLVPPVKLLGYKAMGVSKTETGQPDKCEFFNVGQDDLLGNEPVSENPQIIQNNRPKLFSFLESSDPIVQLILRVLDSQLGLPHGKLASLQRRDQVSGTMIRMIRYPGQVGNDRRTALLQHTDYGTLTILSSLLGGLQILPGGSLNEDGNWLFVKPEPNCVIVNIGDALVEWTGGILRSNIHRVTAAPGEQESYAKYSIAYLMRPERNVSMKRLVGGYIASAEEDGEEEVDLTANEWEIQKIIGLRNGTNIMKSRGGKALKAFPTHTKA